MTMSRNDPRGYGEWYYLHELVKVSGADMRKCTRQWVYELTFVPSPPKVRQSTSR